MPVRDTNGCGDKGVEVFRGLGRKDVDHARGGEDRGWRVLSFDVVVEANDLSF